MSPTDGLLARLENDGRSLELAALAVRFLYHERAAGMNRVKVRRSLSRSPISNRAAGVAIVVPPLGVMLNEGEKASVCDESGEDTADAPWLVNESEAVRLYIVSELNGTRAYSPPVEPPDT
jgi:hypothetical protein